MLKVVHKSVTKIKRDPEGVTTRTSLKCGAKITDQEYKHLWIDVSCPECLALGPRKGVEFTFGE